MIPSNDATHPHEDEQTRALHEQAVAAGEKRLLTRTMDGGRLHSYAADEIGFARAGSGPIGDVTDCAAAAAKSKLGQ